MVMAPALCVHSSEAVGHEGEDQLSDYWEGRVMTYDLSNQEVSDIVHNSAT